MSSDETEKKADIPTILPSWVVDCKHIQSGGLVGEKKAGDEELLVLCDLLGLESFESLVCSYDFAAYSRGRYALTCSFSARVKQLSVYSLDSVMQEISSEFSTELFKQKEDEEGNQFYLQNAVDGIEEMDRDFFDGEVIELGRLVYEFLSLELDNFAQDQGDAEQWRKKNEVELEMQRKKASPFASLQGLSVDKK